GEVERKRIVDIVDSRIANTAQWQCLEEFRTTLNEWRTLKEKILAGEGQSVYDLTITRGIQSDGDIHLQQVSVREWLASLRITDLADEDLSIYDKDISRSVDSRLWLDPDQTQRIVNWAMYLWDRSQLSAFAFFQETGINIYHLAYVTRQSQQSEESD